MHNFGHDAGNQESLFIFNQICTFTKTNNEIADIDSAISNLVSIGSKIEDILILTNGFHKSIRDSGRLKFESSGNRQANFVDTKGNETKAYCVVGRAAEPKSAIVMDRNALNINTYLKTDEQNQIIDQTQFVFKVVDPKDDKEIRNKIVGDNPNWLVGETDDEKETFAALKVWVRILESFQVEVITPNLIHKIDFSNGIKAIDEEDDNEP